MCSLELIKQDGDVFERAVFAVSDFADIFPLYPEVWSKCVHPNRVIGSVAMANENWNTFAGHHYTVILRCWNAWKAKQKINGFCEESLDHSSPEKYLDIQAGIFEFFCLCGSAIDNMRSAFSIAPLSCQREFERVFERHHGDHDLKWFYERRTQFIHKMIIPCFDSSGLPSFDGNHLRDTETEWGPIDQRNVRYVGDFVSERWNVFVVEMQVAWSELLTLVRSRVPAVASRREVLNVTLPPQVSPLLPNIELGAGSGVPMPGDFRLR